MTRIYERPIPGQYVEVVLGNRSISGPRLEVVSVELSDNPIARFFQHLIVLGCGYRRSEEQP